MWGKNKQKRHPSYLEWRLTLFCINGICFLRAHIPDLRGPSSTKSNAASCWGRCRFLSPAVAYESKLSTLRQKTKKRTTLLCALLLVVIRLGFEPKTHSLEGCCSIQLSYRTDPCSFEGLWKYKSERGCKGNAFFRICNMVAAIYMLKVGAL